MFQELGPAWLSAVPDLAKLANKDLPEQVNCTGSELN